MEQNDSDKLLLLTRTLERERKARRLAEDKLERLSREIYESNKMLKQAVSVSLGNQSALEFQFKFAEMLVEKEQPGELIELSMETLKRYLEPKGGFFGLRCVKNGVVSLEVCDGAYNEIDSESLLLAWAQESLRLALETRIAEVLLLEPPVISSELKTFIGEADTVYLIIVFPFTPAIDAYIFLACDPSIIKDDVRWGSVKTLANLLGSASKRIHAQISQIALVHRLKETVAKLRHARNTLLSQEQLAAIGQLAAGVVHEINSPVGYVMSNAQELTEYVENAICYIKKLEDLLTAQQMMDLKAAKDEMDIEYILEDFPRIVDSVQGGLGKVKGIIDSMRTFSRQGEAHFDRVDIRKPIEAALKIAWNELKYAHKVEKHFCDNAFVKGDEGQLQQVFVNLFVNAAHAMKEGGTLTIRVSNSQSKVQVEVEDTGSGMDKETMAKIFKPFYTTKGPGVGTGLGLSLSSSIIKEHKGEISVASVIGEGTSFVLSFDAQHETL